MTVPRQSPAASPMALKSSPSLASMAPIWRRVMPRWRSTPNSRRRASTSAPNDEERPPRPMTHGGELERIGHREGAVKDMQRQRADLAWRGDIEACAAGKVAPARRAAVRRVVPGASQSAAEVGACDRRSARHSARARSPSHPAAARSRANAGDDEARALPASGMSTTLPGMKPYIVDHGLVDPHRRRRMRGRRRRAADQRQAPSRLARGRYCAPGARRAVAPDRARAAARAGTRRVRRRAGRRCAPGRRRPCSRCRRSRWRAHRGRPAGCRRARRRAPGGTTPP